MNRNNITVVISFIILCYSLIVMLGWVFGQPDLTRLLYNEINMKFATAICFLLAAPAVLLIQQSLGGNRELSQTFLPAIILIICLLMGTLFVSGLFGVQTGIETLFVRDLDLVNTAVPGMPSIPTMLAFVTFSLACALSLFQFTKFKTYLMFFSVVIALIGISGFAGYLLHIPWLFYKFTPNSTPIAFNTAAMFILLALALVNISKLPETK